MHDRDIARAMTSADVSECLVSKKRTASSLMAAMKGAYRLHGATGPWRVSTDDFKRWRRAQQTLAQLRPTPYRILLVPRDQGHIEAIGRLIAKSDYKIILGLAVDERSTMIHIETQVPDLAVVDIRLLRSSGMQLLRDMQPWKIPTVVISPDIDLSEFETVRQLGAIDCVHVGDSVSKLETTIAEVIEELAFVLLSKMVDPQ